MREYTTTDLTPEEIHELGLKEVARIDARDAEDDARQRVQGHVRPSSCNFLKTDPQFYAKTPDELLGVSSYVAKRVDGVIGELFRASSAAAVRDHPGAGRACAILYGGPRRARELP